MDYGKKSKLISIFSTILTAIMLSSVTFAGVYAPATNNASSAITELERKDFAKVIGFQDGEEASTAKLVPVKISADDVKIQLNAEVKGKSYRTLKVISPKGETVREYNFNEDGFGEGSKEWLIQGNAKIMVTKEAYPGTWYLQLSSEKDKAEEVSISAKLIDPKNYVFVGEIEANYKNIETEKTVDNKINDKESQSDKKQKYYDYYRSYDEASSDVDNGYIFYLDKIFTQKAIPTVTDAYYKFVVRHANYVEICISTKNLKNEGYSNEVLGRDTQVKFEVVSPDGDTVYSFVKLGKDIEKAANIITEIPIYPGEWSYKVSFGYRSDGINPTKLKITAKYKDIFQDDITWLKNYKLNGS